MVLPDTAFHRGAQVIRIRTKEAGRPGEQSLRVRLAPDQPTEERSAAGAEQVAAEPATLMLASSKAFCRRNVCWAHLAHELFARAACDPRIPLDSARWHEATAHEAVNHQVAQPSRVVHVTLSTRNSPRVDGIRQGECDCGREHMPHRLPVHTGRFAHNDAALLPA